MEHVDTRKVATLMETMPPAEFARTLNLMKPRAAVKFLGTRHPDEAVQWLESLDHEKLVAMIDAIVAVVHFSEELDEESRVTLRVVLPRVD
jgi:Mg/Co/Ni transporter MgtE